MRPDPTTLLPFFKPRGVAVIGASADPAKLGYGIMANLLHPQNGFPGPVYPVNPKAESILGVRCYPGILSVPDPVDLAVIIIPAELTPATLEDCGKRGLKAAIIISGGFREVGREGAAREQLILDIARRYGMRLMGPNGIGVIDAHTPLNTTFTTGSIGAGYIDFISQSGALCGGILDWALARNLRFSRFLSIGNKVDVNETDLLAFLGTDDLSRVIALYLEDIKDGPGFLAAARNAITRKPILVLKSGRTKSGQTATASHTGALASTHTAFRAACRQIGMDEYENIEDMFHAARALAYQPPPRGNRLAILTNAGGPAALAADALEPAGLSLAKTSQETRLALQQFLNPNAPLDGPVDMLGAAGVEQYQRALELLMEDSSNDGILVILVPTILINPAATLQALVSVMRSSRAGKPVLACLMGEASLDEAYAVADQGGLPAYRFPELAIQSFSALHRRAHWLGTQHPQPVTPAGVDPAKARELLNTALQAGRTALDAVASRAVLTAYGIQTPEDILATSPEGAANQATRMGFPVAMKLISPDILHKTEVGGVLLNLESFDAVWEGFGQIVQRARQAYPRAEILGVQIQKMIHDGQEVIIGMTRDPVFGPMIMFGLGGIYVEALGDVSFRLPPLTRLDANAMIDEVRSSRVLSGLRGALPADRSALVDILLRTSQLAVDCPEITEMDINPLIVLPDGQGALAVDARIILSANEPAAGG